MSITISFGWSGFGYKRGTLFGHADGAPLQILKLGLISVVRFNSLRPAAGFGEFLAANIQLDEFWQSAGLKSVSGCGVLSAKLPPGQRQKWQIRWSTGVRAIKSSTNWPQRNSTAFTSWRRRSRA